MAYRGHGITLVGFAAPQTIRRTAVIKTSSPDSLHTHRRRPFRGR